MNPSKPRGQTRILASAGLAALLALAAGGPRAGEADTQVYECNQDGQITFSSQPCAGAQRKLDIRYNEPGPGAAPPNAAALGQADAVAQANLLDNQILAAQQELQQLQIDREAQVAQIKQQMALGTEQMDVNAWRAQMEQQIASVYQDYSNRIQVAKDRLSLLQSQRASLGGPGPGGQ